MLGLSTRTEPLDYIELGKSVFITGVGGLGAGYLHFQLLKPNVQGSIAGVQYSTIVDMVMGMAIGGITWMYAKPLPLKLLGLGTAGGVMAMGLMDELGLFGGTSAAMSTPSVPKSQRLNVPSTPTSAQPSVSRNVGTPESAPPATGTYQA